MVVDREGKGKGKENDMLVEDKREVNISFEEKFANAGETIDLTAAVN